MVTPIVSDIFIMIGGVSLFLFCWWTVLLFPSYLPSRRGKYMERKRDPADSITEARDRSLVRAFVRYWKWLLVVGVVLSLVGLLTRGDSQ